jgi:Zn-dependent protease/predicted transcriptional regulator
MNESIRLGTFRGIPVGINWSLLVIFALITVALALGRFPATYPDLPTSAYVAAAVVTAVLFLASILVHELGHAVVAQRNGIPVEGIVLWLFGGVARLGGEAPGPGAEFRIAAVGPAVSVAVAVVSAAVAAALDAWGAPELMVGAAVWLAVINVVLAVFNLVPAAPLDGGRILRALLWWRHGDPVRSAVTASRAGRVFGFVLVGLGLAEFALGAGVGGLWLVLIGWFLINAARAEESAAVLRGTLGGLRVRDVMTPRPVMVPPEVTIDDLIERYLMRHRFSAFPVGRDPRTVEGLVTLNAVRAVAPDRRMSTSVRDVAHPVSDVMARPDEPVERALPLLDGGRRALVFDGDELVGILSPTDIMRLVERDELRRRTVGRQLA